VTTANDGTETEAARREELERLYRRAREIESELARSPGSANAWPPPGYYLPYHVLMGMLLGLVGAAASLLFNIVGSLAVGQHPLQIIRVYLTFPLGENALALASGLALGIGTCLYLVTGSLYGIAFHVLLTRYASGLPRQRRFAIATGLALLIWLVNFYGVLSWLQPLLFGGRWIVQLVPFWVAAATHLVFGWTLLLIEEWGTFVPYTPGRRQAT